MNLIDIRPVDLAPTLVGRTITNAEYERDGSVVLTLDDDTVVGMVEYPRGGVVACRLVEDE